MFRARWAGDFTAVNEGRLDVLETEKDRVSTGLYKVKPLVESRIEFKLSRWELDDITRGAGTSLLMSWKKPRKNWRVRRKRHLQWL